MASSFDRWEKDPFFSAAEEVQDSADRMESAYRTWMHTKKDGSSMWKNEELRRDLQTALGTTKWQLDVFERAVKASHTDNSIDDARDRHCEFIVAIEEQILRIENSLKESVVSEGKPLPPWVRLDEGECNELALFLSGPSCYEDKSAAKDSVDRKVNLHETDMGSVPDCSKECQSAVWDSLEAGEGKKHGHRRIASASADMNSWKIALADNNYSKGQGYLDEQPNKPPRKIPSVSGFLNSLESSSKFSLSNNGFRKVKVVDCKEDTDTIPLRNPHLSRGINACYEKSKSCFGSCDDCCDKQINGWYGVIQRQLQRSQYQVQYGRPVRVVLWIAFLVCLMVLITLRIT